MLYTSFQRQAESGKKIKQMLSNSKGWTFANIKLFTFFIGHILENRQKNKCVCIHEIIQLIIMKMKIITHRYDINWPGSRHKQKYSKYKKCLIMMLIYIKQHLSNI